jgi:drug/metabolite transporter (DMT)-like permease
MTRLRADFLLLLAALIWGTAFVAQKSAVDQVGPLQFVAGRFLLSALLIAPLAGFEAKKAAAGLRRRDVLLALLTGLCLFAGAASQQIGLGTTTVTNAGFITALYIAFVPLVARFVSGTKLRPSVLGACAVSLAGAWLLANHGEAAHLAPGDLLVLGSAILFALHIILVSSFLGRSPRPFFLSFVQYAVCAVLGGILAGATEPLVVAGLRAALPAIAYAGVLSGGVGYTLQIVGQRHTPATEAALIMSLESVFAALAAAILLGERLSLPAAIGCALVLLGVVMVEVLPALPRRRGASTAVTNGAGTDGPILGEVPMD